MAISHIFPKRVAKCLGIACAATIFLGTGKAFAQNLRLEYSDLAYGYSNCSYTDNGDGTATAEVTISWKQAAGHTGNSTTALMSRGILLYIYDRNGRLQPSSSVVKSVALGDVLYQRTYSGSQYLMYINPFQGDWIARDAVTSTARVTFSTRNTWPSLGIRAGNGTAHSDVADSQGIAYVGDKYGRSCQLGTDPTAPPEPAQDVQIKMSAPDWSLGELKRGEETRKTLAGANNQLCFTHGTSSAILRQDYILTATNDNGRSARGAYLLRHAESTSDTVPYRLHLNDGSTTVSLPNTASSVFDLNRSGKTCFTPTFVADAAKSAKSGAYSDVLTFTVVATP